MRRKLVISQLPLAKMKREKINWKYENKTIKINDKKREREHS